MKFCFGLLLLVVISIQQLNPQEESYIRQYWTPQRMAAALPKEKLVSQGNVLNKPGNVLNFMDDERIRNYWTSSREAQAIPKGLFVGRIRGGLSGNRFSRVCNWCQTHCPSTPTTPPTGGSNPLPSGTSFLDLSLYNQFPFTAVGKVFITQGGIDYVCSGGSVGNNVVLTAGHCVVDGGLWSTNFIFVPNYLNGNAPFGQWVANTLNSFSEWVNNGEFGRDIGFAVVNPIGGLTLQQTVGAMSLASCGIGDQIVVAGYPVPGFGGEQIVTTNTVITTQDTTANPPTNGYVSAMTGGSSGGPVIRDFSIGSTDPNNNRVCGVVSYSYGDGLLYSPSFDQTVFNLYQSLL